MRAQVPIIIQEADEPDVSWKRFVAKSPSGAAFLPDGTVSHGTSPPISRRTQGQATIAAPSAGFATTKILHDRSQLPAGVLRLLICLLPPEFCTKFRQYFFLLIQF